MNYLEKLLYAHSVSGFESEVADVFLTEMREFTEEAGRDVLGNAYATLEGKAPGKHFMLEAHMDEIGFQVLYISDSGYLHVRRNGGIDDLCVPGSRVVIITASGKKIPGVIGKKPIHLTPPPEREKAIDLASMWVDTGLESFEVRNQISVGDVVSFVPNMLSLGDCRVSSKGLDDKIGVYVISQVLRKLAEEGGLENGKVSAVASVQEEVGCRGAAVMAGKLDPDVIFCIDVDFATDVPDCPRQKYGDVSLGEGVVLHRHLNTDFALSREVEAIAAEKGIPVQVSARERSSGGTNAEKMQLVGGGKRLISLGIPCRYMHTPVEMIDLRDVNAAVELICTFIRRS